MLTGGALLVGATLWIVSAIHGVAETNLTTLNNQATVTFKMMDDLNQRITTLIDAQAVIVAQNQTVLDRRITILEAQQIEMTHGSERLSAEIDKLHSTISDLTIALTRVNALLPGNAGQKR